MPQNERCAVKDYTWQSRSVMLSDKGIDSATRLQGHDARWLMDSSRS